MYVWNKEIFYNRSDEVFIFDYLKGTVMQIEKALINDRLHVS